MKWYVMPKDALGQRCAISEQEGKPVNMDGVDIVELPSAAKFYKVKTRNGKEYAACKIAKAIAAGQLTLLDLA